MRIIVQEYGLMTVNDGDGYPVTSEFVYDDFSNDAITHWFTTLPSTMHPDASNQRRYSITVVPEKYPPHDHVYGYDDQVRCPICLCKGVTASAIQDANPIFTKDVE
jgi:hypothetical protein